MKLPSKLAKPGGRHTLATTNLGVVGSPIGHSKSPLLHQAAYSVLGLDWSYGKSDVTAGHLAEHVAGLDSSWRGLSVTMPLKTEANAMSAQRDAHAQYTQAVNTLAFSYVGDTRVAHGYNTDVFGIVSAVTAAGFSDYSHATIIGGGATSLSALVALSDLGFTSTTVILRDPSKAIAIEALARVLGIHLDVLHLADVAVAAPSSVVISTVPGSADVSLMKLPCPKQSVLLDVAYDVWPSPRATSWRERGGVAVSGLSMLAFQALKQVRIFTSDSPDCEMPNELAIRSAMFASVGLNERGL